MTTAVAARFVGFVEFVEFGSERTAGSRESAGIRRAVGQRFLWPEIETDEWPRPAAV